MRYIGLGSPMGKCDFEKGSRLAYMLKLADRMKNVGWVPMSELKGDDLSGGWVEELAQQLQPHNGIITWHWSIGSTAKLGDPTQPISDKLMEMALKAKRLKDSIGLAAVTIHCVPAISIEPVQNAAAERYYSPIDAGEMLERIRCQVNPLEDLNYLCGGILQIETVDIANFRDSGFKLPNYLALQTGSWMDLLWLKEQSGVNITFDSEHYNCAENVLRPCQEISDLFTVEDDQMTPEEYDLARLAGYWLRKDRPPHAVFCNGIDTAKFIEEANPRLFHFGAAVQASNAAGEICTHLPYDRGNQGHMAALDQQLTWIMAHPGCLGGVVEVVGQLYVDDPANPGHNRYSTWSPREPDDETAKEQTTLTIIERLEALTTI